jgi:hypothetical protein
MTYRHQGRFLRLRRPRRTAAPKPPTVRLPHFARSPRWQAHGPVTPGCLAVIAVRGAADAGKPLWVIAPADVGGWICVFPGSSERFVKTTGELLAVIPAGQTRYPPPPM